MKMYKRYALHQSPLYMLHSQRKLASLLKVPLADLLILPLLGDENYQIWPLSQKRRDVLAGFPPSSKQRLIQQPKALLSEVHRRIGALLGRIDKPDYVYSATKGRSYVDNAMRHSNDRRAFKIDIKNFYPSVKYKSVVSFFECQLRCSGDVARLLAKLCCINGALPTGSAVSPVLSYFACVELFQTLSKLAKASELEFTIYVDDMVFSGDGANRDFCRKVERELIRHGYKGHKISHFKPGHVKVITGVAVTAGGVAIPHKRHVRTRLFERAFGRTQNLRDARILGATLIGQYREGERLQRGSRERAKPIVDRLRSLEAAAAQVDKIGPARRKKGRLSAVGIARLAAKMRALRPSV